MKPYDASSEKDRVALLEDNNPSDPDVWSILLGEDEVSLHAPAGEGDYITIPRDEFNAIVDWYMADQKTTQCST